MPHVVTRSCCADASCVYACPVNCIHPTPDEPDFATAEMLYIDPQSCVDCGACVRACPVGAIKPGTSLTEADLPFADLNAMFHQPPRSYPPQAPVAGVVRLERPALRVAVVGSGPAALYAADELLKQRGVEVTVIDRQPTPYGLARAGVAPDHPDTKQIERLFGQIERERGFSYLLGVDVGHDVTDEELAAHHHAVVYATGASRDRRLGIPGEDLPGSATATDFVAWYNGHLDHLHDSFDLANERVVVVGNGNVALDVARILATDPERLAGTDIADHALAALRDADVREVLVLGRRGPAQAAFTMPELLGLVARDDIDIELQGVLDSDEGPKVDVLRAAAARPRRADRRIVFRFRSAPLELTGSGRLDGLRVARTDLVTDQTGRVTAVPTDDVEQVATGLVLRSVGYRGVPVADLPFDDDRCVVPNVGGRVVAPSGEQLAGRYVVGWIKRGPTGFIGTNKSCSLETVNNLLIDHGAGLLPEPAGSSAELADLVRSRVPDVVDLAGWCLIDAAERERGLAEGRPRRKFASRGELTAVAQAGRAHASRARRRVVVTGR